MAIKQWQEADPKTWETLYQKLIALGPGSPNPHDLYRDALVDLFIRMKRLEEQNNTMLAAVRKDLLKITEHAPNVLAAAALIAVEHMED